jgi:hypothetical protein
MEISYRFEGFIGIFDNQLDNDVCDKIIQHFELVKKNEYTQTRQQLNNQITKSQKDTLNYFLSGTSSFANEHVDSIISGSDLWIFEQINKSIWNCYNLYAQQFGVLESVGRHSLSGSVKIQKSQKTQGYHVWHCEHDTIKTGNRLALVLIYLNDVDQGGETEFLYQSLRIAPKQGRIIICPTDFTHTHRGNPTLGNDKYVISTWIEFIE